MFIHWKYMLCCAVLSHISPTCLFVTPKTVAHQASQPMEFSRQEYLSGLLCSLPRDLPDPGIQPMSLGSPAIGRQILYHFTTWKAHVLKFPFKRKGKESY